MPAPVYRKVPRKRLPLFRPEAVLYAARWMHSERSRSFDKSWGKGEDDPFDFEDCAWSMLNDSLLNPMEKLAVMYLGDCPLPAAVEKCFAWELERLHPLIKKHARTFNKI